MRNNILHLLKKRGFIEQITDEEKLSHLLSEPVVCYAGFDPTGSSLHVGHLLPIMALAYMQRNGHRPIVLLGGGTALIGDPSGKNEMRRIISSEEIRCNSISIKRQFSRYIDFDTNTALLLNNEDWLLSLKYIEFLRDIGRHFSVNRMLSAESYRARLEKGLNFIEFNYMLLQSYDFLHLFKSHHCMLQIGGNDQWGNIVAGVELVRRVTGNEVYGLTFPLVTTASGAKMGKTEKGAVWLDAEMTSPYEYYQYWVNCDDRDVWRFMKLFTFLDLERIEKLQAALGDDIRMAKQTLAFEATAITHGKEAAEKAKESSLAVFYGKGDSLESLPTTVFEHQRLAEGVPSYVLFVETGLCSTRSEARRLIAEGGAYVNNVRVSAFDEIINADSFQEGVLNLRAGKKRYHRVILEK